MSSGIYMYENKLNGHKYIGYTNNFKRRYLDHKTASYNKLSKDYNCSIHKAIRKYGLENFDYIILEECKNDIQLMKQRERYWIKKYNTYNNREHYNETPGGDGIGFNNVHKGQEHGMAKLTERDVIYCRKQYQNGCRSKDVYNELSKKTDISYDGFLRMWHGKTWKHIMPEVFTYNPHPSKYSEKDCEIINALWSEYSGKSFNEFTKTEECYVGYGTAYKMVHNPEFYKGK